ncbi:nitric-oxide reductase large subunit [Rugosibacter aromaticivorans]|uniref:nitric-oxide reductase large subunit n=1 Tax=Rugosibacter aromaticivorans TaxID=1565605 RepID=UPI000AAB1EB4|nr:cbb3-type cytochrome c oxidase subunit I [Rugosibacter aromaticivorans]
MQNEIAAGAAPLSESQRNGKLSPWWRRASFLTMALGFSVLLLLTVKAYHEAPPIPGKVTSPDGSVLFTGEDIRDGQQVFLKYGLMDNGSIWGHGALLGPDFSAEYLHTLALHIATSFAQVRYGLPFDNLTPAQRAIVEAEVRTELKQNRYDAQTGVLAVGPSYEAWFRHQSSAWNAYFSSPVKNGGLGAGTIRDPGDLKQLSAFVAWTAWASVANRPGTTHSYTNNFPFDSVAGNTPTADAVLWSALSLVFLLGGTAAVLLAFGKFDYLGWQARPGYLHPKLLGARVTPGQRATLKYFALVALLFLAQTLVGGAVAHYRADPGTFYGFDLAAWLPSNLLRTWHLQLAIFWIATAYVAGALFLAAALGGGDPAGQKKGIDTLFWALVIVVVGSLLGEWAGMRQMLPQLWFWLGDQGWEYLELGRAWQMLLAVALLFWFGLLVRALAPALRNAERREIAGLFLCAAIAIPVFYLPAMFFDGTTHFSVVDAWRFWIIHLWVEGFFEFFVTVMVAIIFLQFGVVTRLTATRVIYLDAILYFTGGFIGTGHHWYWTGQTSFNMALSALFSALEVVPLTLITLDAWDFVRLSRPVADIGHQRVEVPHQWTFHFLMAVGFWNFVGAGIFGFLINLPIVSYFETGTLLTINHGHAAMMGVFGMLGVGLVVFAIRQTVDEALWRDLEKYIRVGFWGLNGGLLMMVVMSLFPAGILQLIDVLENGYWHARSLAYTGSDLARLLEWSRLPGDLVFIVFGVVPIAVAAVRAYFDGRKTIRAAGVPLL